MSDNVIMSFGDISTVEANVSGAAYMGKGDKGDPGEPGVGISSIILNADYTLTINLDDGTSYTTPPIRGEQGERGERGVPGADGHTPVITAEKVGKITTIYVDGVAVATISDGEGGGGGSVTSVNGQTGDVVIVVPDKTSQLTNDSGFLTEHQSLAGYATETYVNNHHDSTKQDVISDLATIRSGAALGATSVQPVAGKDLFSGNYNDLTNKPTIPEAVTETTVSGWGFTKNTGTYVKPSDGIPASDIASGAVTSAKIGNEQVTRAKLASDALYSPEVYTPDTGLYTVSASDVGKTLNNAWNRNMAFSIPSDNLADIPVGAEFAFLRWGTGNSVVVTFENTQDMYVPDATSPCHKVKISSNFGMIAVKRISTTGWIVTGNVEVV